MSKHRVAVLKVVSGRQSVTAAAAECGIGRQHLHRLLRRYREGGLEALEPRSRRPHTNPGRTPEAVRERIVALRTELPWPSRRCHAVAGCVGQCVSNRLAEPPCQISRTRASKLP